MPEHRAAGKAALVLTDPGALQTDLGTRADAALAGTRLWHCTGREYGMLALSSASKAGEEVRLPVLCFFSGGTGFTAWGTVKLGEVMGHGPLLFTEKRLGTF